MQGIHAGHTFATSHPPPSVGVQLTVSPTVHPPQKAIQPSCRIATSRPGMWPRTEVDAAHESHQRLMLLTQHDKKQAQRARNEHQDYIKRGEALLRQQDTEISSIKADFQEAEMIRAIKSSALQLLTGSRNVAQAVSENVNKTMEKLAAQPPVEVKEPLPDPLVAAPCKCAPCNKGRIDACPLAGVVLLLTMMNYASAVLYPVAADRVHYPGEQPSPPQRGVFVVGTYSQERPWGIPLSVLIIFHVPLLLAIISWFSTCLVSRRRAHTHTRTFAHPGPRPSIAPPASQPSLRYLSATLTLPGSRDPSARIP